ncbi:MAG: TPM domain-containing protein, partial [Paenibacillus sp.]|nr:TPM domain-containing protein [Paenibacillus sp.]
MTTAIHDVPVPRSSKWAACAFMLLLMLSLIMPNVAGAASLPAKEGLVQDTAGMIPKESVSYIKQAAQGNTYTYYLLTIDSFDGEIPSDYATSVYQAWKLTADDVLIVLSKQDRRVEMNFNNSTLQAKIDALPDDYNGDGQVGQKLSEFVDAHFIPEAKKGNFARAAIALMQAAEGL